MRRVRRLSLQPRRLGALFTDRHDNRIGDNHRAGKEIERAEDALVVDDETAEQWRERTVEMNPDRAGPLQT